MAVIRTLIGTNPDGSPHYLFSSDTPNPEFVVTGPRAAGLVRLADGSTYDVTDEVIEVASAAHALEVSHEIAVQHERRGTFDNPLTGEKWSHDCTHPENCQEGK